MDNRIAPRIGRPLILLEAVVAAVLAALGLIAITRMIQWREDIVGQLGALLGFSFYLLDIALESFRRVPEIAWPIAICLFLYVLSPLVLARTRSEKRLAGWTALASLLALWLLATAGFAAIFSALAMQGAGR